MDPLDVISNLDKVIPYYQPIYGADTQSCVGIEVVGRMNLDNIHSLEFFFSNDLVPDDYLLEVDNHILIQSLEEAVRSNFKGSIFINRHPSALLTDDPESLLSIFQAYEGKGIKLSNIVIILQHQLFYGFEKELKNLITYYQTYGIKFAINSVNDKLINLEKLRYLSPDIIKIDFKMVQQLHTSSFQDLLHSVIHVARKIGASMYYDGIIDSLQLRNAWKNGGRFYQGAYLCTPQPTIKKLNQESEQLKTDIVKYIRGEKSKLIALRDMTNLIHQRIEVAINKYQINSDLDAFLLKISSELNSFCFRMYICDEDGFQQSSNLFKLYGEQWELQQKYRGRNWSWRPYFLETILKMQANDHGILSDMYRDIETGEKIRTFSYPLENGSYIYIDLSYDFLFKHNELLF
ncbi:EAL domain-containing protein [Gottfriedia solisilvae]|uniref:Diguanylate phosphodiesterase n=1 Tax=Gottfriedia solisilvae TaxID=1516104 RepID=A0A8J3F2K3_9BACI|nr:EAL domain-containing protein [Gottfriedia solisilvae]GGI14586.1 diguanylate phosphodiesterase [Gottfriedia solisilvae]